MPVPASYSSLRTSAITKNYTTTSRSKSYDLNVYPRYCNGLSNYSGYGYNGSTYTGSGYSGDSIIRSTLSNYSGSNYRGYSGYKPGCVTLTGFNRRSSLDHDIDTPKCVNSSSSYLYSPVCSRKKYTLDEVSQLPPNVCGLDNLGNTCYANSILQSLYATQLFKNFIINTHGGPLVSAISRLFNEMNDSNNATVNPASFRNCFIRYQPKFRGYEQQDALEFFQYLINGLQDELNTGSSRNKNTGDSPKNSHEAWNLYKTRENSQLVDMMAGQLSSTVTCTICGNNSTCWDPFWDLSLPLPIGRETTIEKCLKEFTALEELDIGEMANCDRCKKPTKSTKRLNIEKSPQILILHLKKFTNEGYKLTSPRVLADDMLFVRGKTYTLHSIVSHHGNSLRSGHYTAHSKHSKKWFHFNDSRVEEINNFDPSTIEDAYILFYSERECTSRL